MSKIFLTVADKKHGKIADMPPLEIILLTPFGRGAVASLLLTGQEAQNVFLAHWQGKTPTADCPAFGRLQLTDDGHCEETVVHLIDSNTVEMHVHGGDQIVSAIVFLFSKHGAVPKNWQDYVAAGTSQQDLALRILPFAPTERTAKILLDQYNGAFDREMAAIGQSSDCEEKQRRLNRLQELAALGKHLIEPFRVVLAGASNAGKSSLLNAILGFQRSIVHHIPGTTRDVVGGQTALDGFPVTFFDTAGFRETDNDLEQQGIKRSLRTLTDADLTVWVVDPTVEEFSRPACPAKSNVLICCNKMDLANDPKVPFFPFPDFVSVSALTGEGIETLLNMIIHTLVPNPPNDSEAVPLPYPPCETILMPVTISNRCS